MENCAVTRAHLLRQTRQPGPETDVSPCVPTRASAMGTMRSASARTTKITWLSGVGNTASCVYTKSDSALNHHAYAAHAPRAAHTGTSHEAYHGCMAGNDHNSAVIDRNSSALRSVRAYRTMAGSVTGANAARIANCTDRTVRSLALSAKSGSASSQLSDIERLLPTFASVPCPAEPKANGWKHSTGTRTASTTTIAAPTTLFRAARRAINGSSIAAKYLTAIAAPSSKPAMRGS